MRNRKRGLFLMFSCVLVLAQLPAEVFAAENSAAYADYVSGTPREETQSYTVVEVSTEQELWEVAQHCALDTWSLDKKIELKSDIVLWEHTDLVIPSFGGIFEGNGHRILRLQVEDNGSAQGMFRYVQVSGEVRRLNVEGRIAPAGTGSQVGGIAGVNHGVISGCSFSGTVKGESEVGGIAGVNEGTGTIRDCGSTANVTGNHSTGGIAGSNHGTIVGCDNAGSVNIYDPDVDVDIENISLEEMEGLNSTENMAAHTDSGGIAGICDGTIDGCTNSGQVGYAHVGYNTGGIAGRLHQGCLQDCSNSGPVQGRKDVGGIVGQMEPFLEVEYMEDRLQELDRETTVFMNLTEATKDSISAYGDQAADVLKELTENLQGVESGKDGVKGAASDLRDIYESGAEKEEQKTEAVDVLNESMNGAGDNLAQLIEILENSADKTDKNVSALINQARVLQGTMEGLRGDLESFEGFRVQDASDEAADVFYELDLIQRGKVLRCRNLAPVEADTNVGGIVGQIATEYDFDPEDDIEFSGEESLKANSSAKAVVRDSRSQGNVNSKKDYAGGIVGHAEYGAIIACESVCAVSSADGSYVGGIAGVARGTVRNCSSHGELSGKNNVGGIVGLGGNVFHCRAYNTLSATGEKLGAIAGMLLDEGVFSGNYFVENGIGAVDGISYSEGAEPLSYQEFSGLEDLPPIFSRFHVIFLADGVELADLECAYGESVDADRIPDIPEKEGFYGIWPEFDFSCVTRGAVLEADYEKWIGSLAGPAKDEKGRNRLLVEGEFLPGAELTVTESGDVCGLSIAQPLLEKGAVSADRTVDYEKPVTVRILCEDPGSVAAEVETDGAYVAVNTAVMGSYLMFDMEKPGAFRVTETEGKNRALLPAVCAALPAAVLAGFVLRGRRKKKYKAAEAEKEAEDDKA